MGVALRNRILLTQSGSDRPLSRQSRMGDTGERPSGGRSLRGCLRVRRAAQARQLRTSPSPLIKLGAGHQPEPPRCEPQRGEGVRRSRAAQPIAGSSPGRIADGCRAVLEHVPYRRTALVVEDPVGPALRAAGVVIRRPVADRHVRVGGYMWLSWRERRCAMSNGQLKLPVGGHEKMPVGGQQELPSGGHESAH